MSRVSCSGDALEPLSELPIEDTPDLVGALVHQTVRRLPPDHYLLPQPEVVPTRTVRRPNDQ